ncbi:MAG: S49 family peptidase [Rhizobiales bacterium]|nr:S49 family peptidase [Hyphomicrobiales bacterium]MBI3674340.1 S49 family peptidase [Hyphomicrobiales bacterium]
MARPNFLTRLTLRFRKSIPVINHVRLSGAIGIGTPMKPALTAKDSDEVLERAFARKGIAGVAISINSPGGSPVQAAMIHARIRALAARYKKTVYVFCEDVAASGGYWLACAGDEIYADESTVVGSIGVISAGFGFVGALDKLGVERRVHAAGENKAMLDPFKPEKPEDVERLLSLQADVHEAFKRLVRERRKEKLKGEDEELFSGAFWSGRQALERGLIDGLGHLHDMIERKFGPKVVIRTITPPAGFGLMKRLGFGLGRAGFADAFVDTLETRALWWRFGL